MSKYHNRRTTLDGYTFDSKAEARRYEELKLLVAAGEIRDLEVHPRFELIPAFYAGEKGGGKLVRATYYEADFRYIDNSRAEFVIEDVKGVQTEGFKLKRKMFMYKHPNADFRIIEA